MMSTITNEVRASTSTRKASYYGLSVGNNNLLSLCGIIFSVERAALPLPLVDAWCDFGDEFGAPTHTQIACA